MSPRIPILLYHRILAGDATESSDGLGVPVEDFGRDMRHLHARGWHCMSANEAAELTLAGRGSAKTFAVTFDDGFRDFAQLAHPILRDLGFTATVFVVTGRIGGRADWGAVEGADLLDADEVRGLAREGVGFGSHSHTHPRLPACTDQGLLDELSGSRTVLSDMVGYDVNTIAWPFGENDTRTRQAAAEAGYRLGYSLAGDGRLAYRARAALRAASRDRLAIPRREVRGDDSTLRRRLRMGPGDGLFVAARKFGADSGDGS